VPFSGEEHKLQEFESKVYREIFRAKKDEASGGVKMLHNTKLRNLYRSRSIVGIVSRTWIILRRQMEGKI
jgi:hypothetical protein